ncbi:cysteine desulfurase [candidate division WWE3 bacterium CG10_big_fil_rev_8_21_14_0_10_32_10]|uniref:cysteine desulfurase n=1 Tax=candidate division WWE3 bacterium CG10_big_fil_rev_8_21_14_0_10_32_10 TaxID=1975090 RepID=A0A2H0R9G8_UNCKA|nr:MAG: cysteine desulfurase [candidate division WWE3 bacterium CG10_big_fil_rev_8_21_14_0_10_32_10]
MITKNIKKDFPILSRRVNGKRLVYLDNSATSQSPKQVIDSLVDYYSNHRANVHRGIHTLSEESTQMYDNARKNIASFLGAKFNEIVFVRNTTEACNLVALSFLPAFLKKGDTIVTTELEHHSNLIPWQIISKTLGLNLKILPISKEGIVDLSLLQKTNYKFLAITQVSNFLGTVNPLDKIIEISHKKGARVFIDGAQGIPHKFMNLRNLNADFYAFSGHKIYAPFGIGVLYISEKLVSTMPPFLTGGGMITQVTTKNADFLDTVEKFDAGTPNIGGAIALSQALNYVKKLGLKNIENHEKQVLEYLLENLLSLNDIEIYGPKDINKRLGLVSFNYKKVHSHDLASILDSEGVAIRSGHHCAMPAHDKLKVLSSARASIGLYNFKEDIDILVYGIKKAKSILS